MATSVIGYPLPATYCPSCGSTNIEMNDCWHEDGLMICRKCGCKCYIIDASDD